jgi:hypothetical protein
MVLTKLASRAACAALAATVTTAASSYTLDGISQDRIAAHIRAYHSPPPSSPPHASPPNPFWLHAVETFIQTSPREKTTNINGGRLVVLMGGEFVSPPSNATPHLQRDIICDLTSQTKYAIVPLLSATPADSLAAGLLRTANEWSQVTDLPTENPFTIGSS